MSAEATRRIAADLAAIRRADAFRLARILGLSRQALRLLEGRRPGNPLVELLWEIEAEAASAGLPPGQRASADLDEDQAVLPFAGGVYGENPSGREG